jgi:hypothetical protein
MLMCSCAGYQYVASPQYVPLNTKKDDLKANVFYNYAQVGYSVTNHFSMFITGYYRNGGSTIFEKMAAKEGDGADSYDDKSHEVNLGASYFTTSKLFTYEIHVGGGGGKIYYQHTKDLRDLYKAEFNADKFNIFIQPSISYKIPNSFGDYFQFGAFTKIAAHRYYNIKDNSEFGQYLNKSDIDKEDLYFSNSRTREFYFAEPGLCLRAGGKWIKGNATLSFPVNLSGDDIRYRKTNLYLSVFFDLNLFESSE